MPPPSSHTTVRTVPYTAVRNKYSELSSGVDELLACRVGSMRELRTLGGSAAYPPKSLRHFSLLVCTYFQRRMIGIDSTCSVRPFIPIARDYYGLG